MNIVVFGAGAIGSLFGAFLSKNNNVTLIGRKPHIDAIKKNGLSITGLTNIQINIHAAESIKNISFPPDLLILTVKSYDTENVIKQIVQFIDKKTIILSLQNGLDNIDKIKRYVKKNQIIAGVTTSAASFLKPGMIKHTGKGEIIIGELNCLITLRLKKLKKIFDDAEINCRTSSNIFKEIWVKAIINSSINPLTTFFNCKNGYLVENPILKNLVKLICYESTNVAISQGFSLSYKKVYDKTIDVINSTTENYSSMLQSYKNGKKTEIDSINLKIIEFGNTHNVNTPLNNFLFKLIKSI